MALTKVQGEGISGVSISANNEITMSSQPAFSAHKNGTAQSNLAINTTVTITFGTERFDSNSDYNTSNSTFTAPVTGKYFFSTSVYFNELDSGASYMTFGIETSNESYRVIFDANEFSSDLDYHSLTATALADMDANDTAYVHFLQSGGTAQGDANGATNYTYFTGCLIC
jgi:hypothetical protein